MPLTSAETVRRGRLGPGQLLLVDPGRRQVLEGRRGERPGSCQPADPRRPAPDARRPSPEAPSTIRRSDRPSSATSPVSTPSVRGSTSRRWPSRRTSPCGAWATTRRRPVARGSTGRWPITCGKRLPRSRTRRSTRARADRDGPAGGGRSTPFSAARRGPLPLRLAGPILADLDGLFASLVDGGRSVRRLDGRWLAADGRQALATALERLARNRSRPPNEGLGCPCHLRPWLRRGASAGPLDPCRRNRPHRAHRGRPPRANRRPGRRADLLDVHAAAMALAVGATAVHPRLAIAAAAELAGTRGAEELTPADTVGNLMTAFGQGCARRSPGWGSSAVASAVGGALIDTLDLALGGCPLLPDGGRLAGSRHVRRARRPPAPPARRRARHPGAAAAVVTAHARPGLRPLRGDGEAHLFAPRIVGEIQAIADTAREPLETQLGRYRDALTRSSADRAVRAMSSACALQQPCPASKRSSRRARSCAASSFPP